LFFYLFSILPRLLHSKPSDSLSYKKGLCQTQLLSSLINPGKKIQAPPCPTTKINTMLQPCTFQSVSGPVPTPVQFTAITYKLLSGHNSHFRLVSDPTRGCVQLVPLMHSLGGFHNEGLLSVPQIKHMTYATMLPSYCSYCL
jgi:hypothetical protein